MLFSVDQYSWTRKYNKGTYTATTSWRALNVDNKFSNMFCKNMLGFSSDAYPLNKDAVSRIGKYVLTVENTFLTERAFSTMAMRFSVQVFPPFSFSNVHYCHSPLRVFLASLTGAIPRWRMLRCFLGSFRSAGSGARRSFKKKTVLDKRRV